MSDLLTSLKPHLTPQARVRETDDGALRLEIPAGPGGSYRLAQLDDYCGRRRDAFPQRPPLRLALRARASASQLPGTWGFGLWNDPFSMDILSGQGRLHLPALPNTAWFFFASPQNHLSLRDDLPANGSLAAVFRSRPWPPALLLLGAPGLPLLLIRPLARLARRLGRRFVQEAGTALTLDPAEWHRFALEWRAGGVSLEIDGTAVLQTALSPYGPLGTVIWIDNQYAAFLPSGQLRYGMLPNPEVAWIEIRELQFEHYSVLDNRPTCE